MEVDLSKRDAPRATPSRGSLRFAIGTMLSPREAAKDYRMLADYLETRLGRRIQVLQRRGYTQTNALLENGEADFAFICSGAYVALKQPAEILAVPLVDGKATYASLIIVRKEDAATRVEDLRGASFAFVDRLSLTGRIYPEWLFKQVAADSGSPFSETVFTHSHSESIDLVAAGRFRAAAVDSLVFGHLSETEPARVANLRVLQRSEEFGIPPIVAGPNIDAETKRVLRLALLEAHDHAAGRGALEALGFDRFARGDPQSYRGAAEMRDRVFGALAERGP